MLTGTCARAGSLLVSATDTQQFTAPPKVTVADTEPGPTTLVGFTETDATVSDAFDRNSLELIVVPA
jgi:hypothetical protein